MARTDFADSRPPVLHPRGGNQRNVVDIGQLGRERKCSTEKEYVMSSPVMFRSPYQIRVNLVRDTIMARSKLGDKAAADLAVHVLHALDSIPEKIR